MKTILLDEQGKSWLYIEVCKVLTQMCMVPKFVYYGTLGRHVHA